MTSENDLVVGVIETKLYQQFRPFIDEDPKNKVTIELISGGKIKVTKQQDNKIIYEKIKNRSIWLYGEAK